MWIAWKHSLVFNVGSIMPIFFNICVNFFLFWNFPWTGWFLNISKHWFFQLADQAAIIVIEMLFIWAWRKLNQNIFNQKFRHCCFHVRRRQLFFLNIHLIFGNLRSTGTNCFFLGNAWRLLRLCRREWLGIEPAGLLRWSQLWGCCSSR